MKRLRQDHGFGSAINFSAEIPGYFPQCSSNGLIHQSPVPESVLLPNSSSSIIDRIGSASSALYATEVLMGLPQCGFQENNSMFSMMSYPTTPPYGNDLFQDSQYQTQPTSQSYINPCNNFSESAQLQYLKDKLLGEFDESTQDLCVSQNSYATQLGNVNQFGITQINNTPVSSSKTRIRWSQDLHDRFVKCVTELGGPDKATPKAILKLMDTDRLTILHIKSHLQKYRNAKTMPEFVEGKSDEKKTSSSNVVQIDIKNGMELKEALQMQLNVQKHLHDQLEIQQDLQLRIEEQWKQLQMMLAQQHNTSKSFLESKKSDKECPNNLSTPHEDPDVVDLESSDDDMAFPFKIS